MINFNGRFSSTLQKSFIVLALILSGCTHSAVQPEADRVTASSVDGVDEAREASYAHGGKYNYNAKVAPVTPVADVDPSLVSKIQQRTRNSQNPDLVITGGGHTYHYQPNADDIVARHTFVLMDAARTVGHHVAFFQSRHQHHVVLKLKYDFSGNGLAAGTEKNAVKAGQTIFNNTILKTKPKTGFFAVQVAPGTNFELMTIATGNTRKFKGIFTDGIIGITPNAARLNPSAPFDVVVEVEAVNHFNRMFVSEDEKDLQYMAFKNNGGTPGSYVLVHLINGKLKPAATRQEQDLNIEQALIATSANTALPDGTIVKINGRTAAQLLNPNDKVDTAILRTGFDEAGALNNSAVGFSVVSQTYKRAIGFDGSQEKARQDFTGQ